MVRWVKKFLSAEGRRGWLVVLLATVLYLPTVGFEFAYDDVLQITLNPQVNGTGASGWYRVFVEPTPPGNLYRPLVTASYRLTYLLGEGGAWVFHLVNVLLYGCCAALVLAVFRRYLSPTGAVVGALLFVVHPVHVEVVANSIGRAELLAAVLGLGGFLLLTGGGSGRATVGGAILVALGAFSKESALTVYLAVALAVLGGRGRERGTRLVGVLLVSFVFTAVYLGCRYVALNGGVSLSSDGVAGVENPLFHLGFFERIIPSFKVLGDYVALLLFPFALSADYSAVVGEFFREVHSPLGYLRIALFGGFLALLLSQRRERYGFLGVWFLVSFSLTANVFVPIGTVMGERLAFLPSVGFIGFFVGLGERYRERFQPWMVRAVPLTFFMLYLVRTVVRIPVWRSNDTLLPQTVLDRPQSPKALYNYGTDRFVRKGELAEAERAFQGVLQMVPDHLLSLQCLADIALKRGDAGQLERWYRRILEVTPGEPVVTEQLKKLRELQNATSPVG